MTFVRREIRCLLFEYLKRGDAVVEYQGDPLVEPGGDTDLECEGDPVVERKEHEGDSADEGDPVLEGDGGAAVDGNSIGS